MRNTFGQLITTTYDYISQASGSVASSTIANFVKDSLNKKYHLIQAELRGYINRDLPQTASTAEDQQRYHYPQNIYPPLVSATIEVGDVDYPLTIIQSQSEWDQLNQVDFSGTTIPQYIFPMRDHFEVWPIPQEDDNTITLIGNMLDRDMTADDYTTGTVTVAENDATITGAGTTFTAAMEGRWFQTTNDQYWYRLDTYTDGTHFELESVFEGADGAAQTYTIGESPEIPPELHELLPHGSASDFFSGPRKDFNAAQAHLNYFWTGDYSNVSRDIKDAFGGVLGAKKRYSRRGEGRVIDKSGRQISRFDERWSTTLE